MPPFTVASFCNDHTLAAMDPTDAGDNARARRLVVVHACRRQCAELKKRRAGVEQSIDTLAREEFAPLLVLGHRLFAASEKCLLHAGSVVRHHGVHYLTVGTVFRIVDIDLREPSKSIVTQVTLRTRPTR